MAEISELEDELTEDKAVLPLELFFDLVFVLGITQTVALVADGHDGRALWRVFLVLAMLWWAWTQFSWTANSIDLRRFAFFAAWEASDRASRSRRGSCRTIQPTCRCHEGERRETRRSHA